MMKKAIFLNGPMGVGKTTVGRLLQGSLPQTAFIDGDWCLDIEPFVGDCGTRAMAVDNILHLLGNYEKCPCCQNIVVAWLMDRPEVREALDSGARGKGLEPWWFTLGCSAQALRLRWEADGTCPWRTGEWLDISLRSLGGFAGLPGQVDTTGKTAQQVRNEIIGTIQKLEGQKWQTAFFVK